MKTEQTNACDLPWKREDVLTVLRHIAVDEPYAEDHQSADYCIHCRAYSGNARLAIKQGVREADLHRPDCVWLLANNMLTGMPELPVIDHKTP